MILPFYGQLYFCTFGYHHKHYNQHHVAWPRHRLAQLVDHKFLIFHQFLDCILLGFLNHYKDLYIYALVRSIRLQVLVIFQWPCEYPKHLHQDLSCLFCSFSLVIFWLINWSRASHPTFGLNLYKT